jgi:Transposase DDE domain
MPYKANEPRCHKIPKARYKIENWAEYDALRRQPKKYSDIAIEAGLMLRLAFGRPWRQTEGMLGSIMDLLVHVVIDSTGLKVFRSGEWLHEKHGGRPRRSWRKLHLAIDPDSGETLTSELTTTGDGRCIPGRPAARPDRLPDFRSIC